MKCEPSRSITGTGAMWKTTSTHFGDTMMSNLLVCSLLFYGQCDSNAQLNTEDVVRSTGDLWVLASVPMQIQMVNMLKVPFEVARIPSKAKSSTKLLLETKHMIPSRPFNRSAAQRKNLTYASPLSLLLLLALESREYVSRMRPSTTLYFRFLLLSFSFFCPTLYGGLPIITVIAAPFSRPTSSVLASVNNAPCSASAISSVSAKQ